MDLADVMTEVDFKVFSRPAKDPRGRVAALCQPGGGELTRSQIAAGSLPAAQTAPLPVMTIFFLSAICSPRR